MMTAVRIGKLGSSGRPIGVGRPGSPVEIASAAAAVRSAGDLPRLDQLEPDVVGRPYERDARPIGHLDRPLQQAGAEALEPLDVGLQVRGVEAEVLEPMVRARVAGAEGLAGARAGDVHGHAAVLALTADEAVAERTRLIAHDLEVEGLHVPVRRLPRIRRLQVDVVDTECHEGLLVGDIVQDLSYTPKPGPR